MGALKNLSSRIAQLGNIPDVVGEELAIKLKDQVDQSFSSGTDPYGQAWAPNADGSASHLTKTDFYRSSSRAQYGSDGKLYLKLGKLANIHQNGSYKMPRRSALPDMRKPLPERWETIIADTVNDAVGKAMK